jgi:hypothetical protein
MNDDVLRNSFSVPAMSGGKVYFSDEEIEYIGEGYALHGAGYDYKTNKTGAFQQVQRKNAGSKLWEEMTRTERKQECFAQIKNDLIHATMHLEGKDKASYLLTRANDAKDPMQNFYKLLLIKFGAKTDGDGTIVNFERLSQKLNWDLDRRQLIDLIPINELEQDIKLEITPQGPSLGLRLGLTPDWGGE